MKTRKFLFPILAAVAIFAVSCSETGKKQTNESTEASTKNEVMVNDVNLMMDESRVVWYGEMLGLYSHEGTIDIADADLMFKDGKINGGTFVIDMTTITPTDDNYNPSEGSTPEKLVGHLSSTDFFDVPNNPTAKFEITKVNGKTAEGMLTVRGISKPEKVENIMIAKEGKKVMITGELIFDRKDFNVSWDHPIKERVLGNDIEITFELVGEEV
jgi:polyisoprenoid-binding protein YceI